MDLSVEIAEKDLQFLEFDKLIHIAASHAIGSLGRQVILDSFPSFDFLGLKKQLSEVDEFVKMIENDDYLPVSQYEPLSEEVKLLGVDGYVLPVESIRKIYFLLVQVKNLEVYFRGAKQELYPLLFKYVADLDPPNQLIKAVDKIIDEDGNVRSDASTELVRIRRQISAKHRELDGKFRRILNDYKSKGMVADTEESLRGDRRVLTIPAEFKRQVKGILHDESASGKTVYIEPEEIIFINNEIFELQNDEKKEIYKLLKVLCAEISPFREDLLVFQTLITQLDVIQAKGRFAIQMDAKLPALRNKPFYKLLKARHPLLLLKNKALKKKVVPFDYELRPPGRILVLSGPNAGGKTITMKAVALLQIMAQCGFLIPVDDNSEIGLVKKIYADLGDGQSIENELSTYSSRLQNMNLILEKGDRDTLVLIDEFGNGTDPKIGAAIAESILKAINEKGIYGLITTHYPNLKTFAFKQKGLINGSMTFDKDSLMPRYELKVGRPGSSYAFEIAQRVGLPKYIMKYARKNVNSNDKAIDELLVSLQAQKQSYDELLESSEEKEKRLQKLIFNYENLHKDLEYKRKKLKLEQKNLEVREVYRQNKEFEKLIRELKEEKNVEKAKKTLATIKSDRKEKEEDLVQMKKEVLKSVKRTAKIEVGDYVKLVNGSMTGKVVSIAKQKAQVSMGIMQITAHLSELIKTKEPIEINSTHGIQTNFAEKVQSIAPDIDLRGMSKSEALELLETFLDKSYVVGAKSVKILHGKGNGVLRKAVWNKLREYKDVSDISHPPDERGGDGVTYVSF